MSLRYEAASSCGESQVRSADLRQLPASPETCQGKWRVGSAGEHEVERRRCVIDEVGDRLVDVRRVDDVVVVEHHDDTVGKVIQIVEQRRHHRRQRLRRLQRGERAGANLRRGALDRGNGVRPEHRRVIVTCVQRQPRRRRPLIIRRAEPLGQKRRLAKPRRCRHQRHRRTPLAAARRLLSRCRCTTPGRRRGACSFVASSGRPAGLLSPCRHRSPFLRRGLRCPVSSRDNVLLEIPVATAEVYGSQQWLVRRLGTSWGNDPCVYAALD